MKLRKKLIYSPSDLYKHLLKIADDSICGNAKAPCMCPFNIFISCLVGPVKLALTDVKVYNKYTIIGEQRFDNPEWVREFIWGCDQDREIDDPVSAGEARAILRGIVPKLKELDDAAETVQLDAG